MRPFACTSCFFLRSFISLPLNSWTSLPWSTFDKPKFTEKALEGFLEGFIKGRLLRDEPEEVTVPGFHF